MIFRTESDSNPHNPQKQDRRFPAGRTALCAFPHVSGIIHETNKTAAAFFRRASVTVEAALAFPVFFFCLLTLISMLNLYADYSVTQLSLQEAACRASLRMAAAGEYGIPVIEKTQRVVWEPAWVPFPVSGTGVPCRARVAAWTGRTDADYAALSQSSLSEELVYVAETGSVYHTDSSCTYLDLSVHAVAGASAGRCRNNSGAKYHACEKCVGSGGTAGTVYITDDGTRYHNDPDCSSLKRTIRLVRQSEADGLPLCSRCAAGTAHSHGSG